MASKGMFVRLVGGGSEEMYDFTCSHCFKDGRNVEAINFCEECQEYFCFKCVQDHNRFAIMRTHTLLDKAGMMAQTPHHVLSLPTERCKEHHGNLIDTYCGNHDVVCCPTCVSVNHRSCIDVTYLPKAAKGVQSSDEYRNVKSSLDNVNYKLGQMKKARKGDLDRLQQDKLTSLRELQKFTRAMIKRLNDLEKTTIEELRSKYTILENNINEDINALDGILTSVDEGIKQIETYKGNSEAEIFVYVKDGKRTEDKARGLLEQIGNKRRRKPINFTVDHTINSTINDLKSLGKLIVEPSDYNVSLRGNYNVKINDDKDMCNIIGSCQLDDGTIVIADYENKNLKRLDNSYQVRDQCALPGSPYAVCPVGSSSNEVAVTLHVERKVQFVTIGESMSLASSFSTGDYCRGIYNVNGQLFISCNDGVKVFNKTGTSLRTIKQDSSGQKIFSYPGHITVSTTDAKLHVADNNNRLISIDVHGRSPSVLPDPLLKNPWGVCVGPDDQLFVGGFDSHNIFMVSGDGVKYKMLLSGKDGIKHPRSLCYDKVNSRLVVSLERRNEIKVYDLLQKQ